MATFRAIVDREHKGMRLDIFLTSRLLVSSGDLFSEEAGAGDACYLNGGATVARGGGSPLGLSRAAIQKLIAKGQVTVNGRQTKAGDRLRWSDRIEVQWVPVQESGLEAEALPLQILYEDSDLIALNKPPGLVVHPAPGNPRGTLVNALLYHCPDLVGIGGKRRPGIVHRLDKETSGQEAQATVTNGAPIKLEPPVIEVEVN